MKRKFVQDHIAGVAPRSIGIGGQTDDAGAVGEFYGQLPNFCIFEERSFQASGGNAHRLNMLQDLLHEFERLALAAREHDPERAPLQAVEHGFERSGEAVSDLRRFHGQLEARTVLDPAALIGVERHNW